MEGFDEYFPEKESVNSESRLERTDTTRMKLYLHELTLSSVSSQENLKQHRLKTPSSLNIKINAKKAFRLKDTSKDVKITNT